MLKIFPELKNSPLMFAGVLLVCFLVSVGVRYQQFETWKKTPTAYFVGERPMMTTLDAPYWLRWAREYNEGTYGQKEYLRGYPESTETFQERLLKELSIPLKYKDPVPTSSSSSLSSSRTTEIYYRDVPFLSFLIAKLSIFFNHNYYLTGTLMIPFLASIFILPLGFFFFMIGVPLSGLLGGLIGTFAGGYYMRSSIGRIDTDMLNLFFPVLMALLILLASRAKTERSILLFSIGAGICFALFQWWYNKAGFALIYFVVLVFILFIQKIRFRTILLSSLLFVLCMGPGTFFTSARSIKGFLIDYSIFKDVANESETVTKSKTTPASFPSTLTTISEVDRVPMEVVFLRVLSNPLFSWMGFLAFFGLAVFRWRVLLPLAPMLALGLLSFQSSNRFIMYLAPFIGIGLGWLLSLAIEGVFVFWPRKDAESAEQKALAAKGTKEKKVQSFKVSKSQSSSASEGEVPLWVKIISWLRMGAEDAGKSSLATKGAKDTKGKKVQSFKDTEFQSSKWWNWVRQGTLYLGMGVFFWLISGQTAISFVPGPSIHTGIYKTFLEMKTRVPEDSALLTWWDYGYAITDATGLATFHDGGSQFTPKTYFTARGFISPDQDELYNITQYLSTEGNRGIAENNTSPEALLEAVHNPQQKPWNPIYLFFTADMTGKYGAISKLGSWDIVNGGSKPRGYQNLACNKITNEEMNCRGAKIDLKAGKINNQVPLRRLVFIRDGQVLREQEFGHTQGHTLQLLVAGKQIVEVQLIDEVVFLSNYNQMFLLGRYRDDLYEETYNAFPFSRLFRVKYQ
jgi:hypothetical protein